MRVNETTHGGRPGFAIRGEVCEQLERGGIGRQLEVHMAVGVGKKSEETVLTLVVVDLNRHLIHGAAVIRILDGGDDL